MTASKLKILAINSGSSSIKFGVFALGETVTQILEGEISRIGLPDSVFHLSSNDGVKSSRSVMAEDHDAAISLILNWIERDGQVSDLTAIGHRIVHGGPKYSEPQTITDEMIRDLRDFVQFDPEHLPDEISVIEAIKRRLPEVPQVACFDTAFHRDLPRVARMLPIPRRYEAKGVRRYGFHGLSYEFLISELERLDGNEAANGRVILAHLGSGASLAAVRRGKSIDTSMSFTPAAGVPMSTRSGDLDPGILPFLSRTEQMSPVEFNYMINFKSGLLGISETSGDMQDLVKCESQDPRAEDAISLFCYQVKKVIGSYAAALGGLDTLVFAGGIGENSSHIRSRICEGLEFLGIQLQNSTNETSNAIVSNSVSAVKVRVIHTDEELTVARSVFEVLRAQR